jgi:hypothetical protein
MRRKFYELLATDKVCFWEISNTYFAFSILRSSIALGVLHSIGPFSLPVRQTRSIRHLGCVIMARSNYHCIKFLDMLVPRTNVVHY